MKRDVVIDFETVSECDLKRCGSARYAEDITTEIICLSFEAPEGGSIATWMPGQEGVGVWKLALDPEVVFSAHNAGFEKDIWRNIMVPLYGFPDVPNERWHCTLSVCAQKGLPQDLDKALGALRLPDKKDMEGSKLVRSLSKKNKKTGLLPVRTPTIIQRVGRYCEQDVLVERSLHKAIGWLQPGEREVWLFDQKVNERGIRIDLDYVHAAQKVVGGAVGPLDREFKDITGGLDFTQVARIQDWLHAEKVFLPDLRRETITQVLGEDIDADEETLSDDYEGALDGEVHDLPAHVRRALEIRHLVSSASIKKLDRMEACVCADGRARRLLQYHGAGPGRWAGRIIQPQNFPRPTVFDKDEKGRPKKYKADVMVNAIMTGDHEWVAAMIGPPVQAVVTGLRHALIAGPGETFLSGDFRTIEACVVLALAGQWDKVDLMRRAFAGEKDAAGREIDVYCDAATLIHGRPIDKDADPEERQDGKGTVLGCGFQMGWRKYHSRYCPDKPEAFAQRVINIYRHEWAPEVPKVWAALEEAALLAVYEGGAHEAYGVTYRIEGAWLTARLPSGRKLFYYRPTQHTKEMPWSTPEKPDFRASWRYLAMKQGKLTWIDAFGGHLTENVVQALARDLLVHASLKLEANGFPIVLTVHDEDLAQVAIRGVDEKAFAEIMSDPPEWARAMRIPVAVETWVGDRYKK